MGDSVTISRRDFTVKSALAVLAGATITITACDSDSPTAPTDSGGDATAAVSQNHGHVAQITSAQLAAGGAIQLNIEGTAAHPHTVALTMNDVGQIAAGTEVSKQSSTDASTVYGTHFHTVTFS